MEHPNIVRVFEAGEADGFLYMALEYVEGIDVYELVERRGVVPVKRSTDIIKQTALALQHAHRAGDRPPRHQAVQSAHQAGRQRQTGRHGTGPIDRRHAGDEHHAGRHDGRHRRLHGSRAGPQQQVGRHPQRYLFARLHLVSHAHRPSAVSRREHDEQVAVPCRLDPTRSASGERPSSRRDRRHHSTDDGPQAGRPLSDAAGTTRRSRSGRPYAPQHGRVSAWRPWRTTPTIGNRLPTNPTR